jgi:hypothetical protein
MRPGDRVILCLAVPVWIYAHKYRQLGRAFDETDLVYLREHVLAPRGVEVTVLLAGDLHHYRRHEEVLPPPGQTPVQKITAGGGGAFLHATHDEDVARILEEPTRPEAAPRIFELRTAYPDLSRSWRLSFGNLLFPLKNPKFGIVPALVYLMTAWIVGATIGVQQPTGALDALRLTGLALMLQPGLALWIGIVAAIFLVFTDTHSKVYRVCAGLAHAAVHWTCIFYVGWGAVIITGWLLPGQSVARFLVSGAIVFAAGWIVGSFVMGLYLLVSLNLFGRHGEQAFSALRIEDFKNFLRLHIARDGSLTIHPVKIERAPRRWRDRAAGDATASRVVPDEPIQAAAIIATPDGVSRLHRGNEPCTRQRRGSVLVSTLACPLSRRRALARRRRRRSRADVVWREGGGVGSPGARRDQRSPRVLSHHRPVPRCPRRIRCLLRDLGRGRHLDRQWGRSGRAAGGDPPHHREHRTGPRRDGPSRSRREGIARWLAGHARCALVGRARR